MAPRLCRKTFGVSFESSGPKDKGLMGVGPIFGLLRPLEAKISSRLLRVWPVLFTAFTCNFYYFFQYSDQVWSWFFLSAQWVMVEHPGISIILQKYQLNGAGASWKTAEGRLPASYTKNYRLGTTKCFRDITPIAKEWNRKKMGMPFRLFAQLFDAKMTKV